MALNKYNAIIQAANEANEFGYIIDSNIKRIRLYIGFIRKYNEEIKGILDTMHELVDANAEHVKGVPEVPCFFITVPSPGGIRVRIMAAAAVPVRAERPAGGKMPAVRG